MAFLSRNRGIHKALDGLCKIDFITWDDNFDLLQMFATYKIKEGAIECYHCTGV